MIALLQGRIEEIDKNAFVLMVGGVGYRVYVSETTQSQCQVGEEKLLYIYTHVREDALQLFGFITRQEQELFETMLNVSGIGPRLAMAVLSHLSPDVVVRAILSSDIRQLTKVPGIGKKTAERIILELKDRLKDWQAQVADTVEIQPIHPASDGAVGDAIDALMGLGYTADEAESAVAAAFAEQPEANAETLLRRSLRLLQPVDPLRRG